MSILSSPWCVVLFHTRWVRDAPISCVSFLRQTHQRADAFSSHKPAGGSLRWKKALCSPALHHLRMRGGWECGGGGGGGGWGRHCFPIHALIISGLAFCFAATRSWPHVWSGGACCYRSGVHTHKHSVSMATCA